jgi:glycosyltransferase involved in cell wall biosynthesis
VIHAHSFLSCAAALALGAVYRKPVAYTEHWTIFIPENPGRLSRLMSSIARLALERADIVLPVSADLRAALASRAPRARFRVIPNAVDVSLFAPAKRGSGAVARLLTVGLLDTPRKGLDVLLEALALVPEPLRLQVVGDGGLRGEYERLAERLGLGDRVVFRGLRPKQDVAEAMRESDLFVLGSRFENNPCVVIEAMATGLPVVATRVGGVPEIVDESNGLLAEPRDPASLAARISEALRRLPSYDRDGIASRARERYGREAVGRELGAVYRQLAG